MTRRYVGGERVKFVSPLGMFLFSVFLMFAVLQASGASLSSLELGPIGVSQSLETADRAIVAQLHRAHEERGSIARGSMSGAAKKRLAELDRRIFQLGENRKRLGQVRRSGASLVPIEQGFTTGSPRLDKGLAKLRSNPALALYKLQANGYKFSWLLIPISVPFVWLLFFWDRRYNAYDHSVFATYSLAAMLLLAGALTLVGYAGVPVWIIMTAALILPPVHMLAQLRHAYLLTWPAALLRTVLLVAFCFVTASLFFLVLLGIGAMG